MNNISCEVTINGIDYLDNYACAADPVKISSPIFDMMEHVSSGYIQAGRNICCRRWRLCSIIF